MDLVAVIAHLKVYWPSVAGRVAGAAEMTASMTGEVRAEAWPSAYVVPLGLEAEPNDETNALYQLITERIGIAVEFDNSFDRRGQSVTQIYAPVQAALLAALLNWRDTDPEHTLRGFELSGAAVLQTDRARIFYQWEFTLPSVITDADGWQVNPPPLRRIATNQGPNDPQPPFGVDLPQP